MTTIGSNGDSKLAPGLARKEWRPPGLRKLPIAATAGSTGKASGANNDGNGTKSGDVSNVS
jgi:hypothetical protein